MAGFPSVFGGADEEELFEEYDEFVPETLPRPGEFLDGHDVLTGDAHVRFHEVTRDVFEERGVYDMTFGYNLARLNLDRRHEDAGYRYAEEADDGSVLRAEFTPTTPFCPQSDTLTTGSFRAWNGEGDRHEYDLVRVRVDDVHQRSDEINDTLAKLEERYRETGSVTRVGGGASGPGSSDDRVGRSDGETGTSRGYGPDAPF